MGRNRFAQEVLFRSGIDDLRDDRRTSPRDQFCRFLQRPQSLPDPCNPVSRSAPSPFSGLLLHVGSWEILPCVLLLLNSRGIASCPVVGSRETLFSLEKPHSLFRNSGKESQPGGMGEWFVTALMLVHTCFRFARHAFVVTTTKTRRTTMTQRKRNRSARG